jgi:YHS domain-containing protein
MRFIAALLGILMLGTGLFAQDAFDEEVPVVKKPVKKEAPAETKTTPATVSPAATTETTPSTAAATTTTPSTAASTKTTPATVSTTAVTEVKPAEPVKTEPVVTTAAAEPAPGVVVTSTEVRRPADTVCAVNGVKIVVTDKTPFSDYGGVRYYFLDERAKGMFEKAQYKYTKDILTCKVCGRQEKKRGRHPDVPGGKVRRQGLLLLQQHR